MQNEVIGNRLKQFFRYEKTVAWWSVVIPGVLLVVGIILPPIAHFMTGMPIPAVGRVIQLCAGGVVTIFFAGTVINIVGQLFATIVELWRKER